MDTRRSQVLVALVVVLTLGALITASFALGFRGAGMMTWPWGGNPRTNSGSQPITMDQAVQIFKNQLVNVRNTNIGLHEVEEYQYNFYASYYEKDTGNFAFQMVIWKTGTTYTMGMMGYTGVTGVADPEMGPNMMWNTKYHATNGMMEWNMMGGNGMMGNRQGTSGPMTYTGAQAKTFAQQYLNGTFPGKMAGDADIFYGYYNIDVLSDWSSFGMLSVNGYTGQVWYHTWHGTYIQTVTVS